jgi:hypothetical protein
MSVVSVGLLGWIVPGGGLALALTYFFTGLREHAVAKWLMVGLGAVLALGAVFGLGPIIDDSMTITTETVSVPELPGVGRAL